METNQWVLDPSHSELQFKIKHLMITNVTGNINSFDINVTTKGDDFSTAEIHFTADVNSIDTNSEQRDGHLKSPDFFDAAQFPVITFKGTGTENKHHDGHFDLHGDLTIKGVTKNIHVNVEFGGITKDPYGNVKAGFTVSGKINRTDFGLTWNAALETGGVMVSEEVKIMSEIQLIKK